MAIEVSHILSEKAIKKLGLDKNPKSINEADKVPVKEWDSRDAFYEEEFWQRHENRKWYVKVGDFFKYRIGWRLRDWWIDTKWYFRNLRTFQPILKEWRSYNYHYQVDLFKFGIKQLAEALEYYGNEVPESRHKRIAAMNELIKEIDRDYEHDLKEKMNYDYLSKSEKVVKYSDGSISFQSEDTEEEKRKTEEFYKALVNERKEHYNKIFSLIIGQDDDEIKKEVERRIAAISEEEKQSISKSELYHQVYNEVWDGSGIEGWWD